LPSALARGSESGIYSHKVHIRTYVRGGSRSGMSRGMSLHTIGIGIMCVTHSYMLDHGQRRSLAMEMESGTTAQRGHRGLDTTNTKQLPPTANVTRATRASPAPVYMTHAHSLHTGARQRCTCVFL